MNKFLFFLILFLYTSGCSLNKNSKFWTETTNLKEERINNYEEIFAEDKALSKELNSNLKIKLNLKTNLNLKNQYLLNNEGMTKFDGILKKSSRYKFSKIENFYKFEPTISFNNKNLIFFDDNGSIIKFNEKSKLIWKKNYYSKSEKKLKPILQFSNDKKNLIVADNIAKYYMLDLSNGELIWTKTNLAPFNSEIKIYKDRFFLIDYSNTLRCFSLKNGDELWNLKTENSLIRSQKKLSMVIANEKVYFNNSIGDISAVDINRGELVWQLPTQSNLIYESAFSLETSDIVADKNTLFFSNNKNQFFSIDLETGSFNWENKVNSNLRPIIVGDYILTVSLEGYLVIIEKKSGNIIRVTDVFNFFKEKQRKTIKPTGFVVGINNVYLSTSNGRMLLINIASGKTTNALKIDNDQISKPFVLNKDLFVVKDNAIIKLN